MWNYIIRQLEKRGYQISKNGVTDKTSIAYRKIISQFNIDYVIDIGANEGQFAKAMRKLGYSGHIASFEPLSHVYKILKKKAENDQEWDTYKLAFGNEDGFQEINVSKNTVSSSMLEILPAHIKQESGSAFIGTEKIEIKKIDTILPELQIPPDSNLFFKLDVQGYEKFVLEGGVNSFKKIKVIQLEMSLIPLYKGELLLDEMIRYMDNLGYKLYNLWNGFNNYDTGQIFQVDGIFVRSELINL